MGDVAEKEIRSEKEASCETLEAEEFFSLKMVYHSCLFFLLVGRASSFLRKTAV